VCGGAGRLEVMGEFMQDHQLPQRIPRRPATAMVAIAGS
jgi:hypothetical protein